MNNDYGILIFADLQADEPQYLCLRENGELYVCNVAKTGETFVEKNTHELSTQEAMTFVADSFRRAMDTIQKQK